jgi:hypothetical protein
LLILTCCLFLASPAAAETFFDNIGPDNGSGLAGNMVGSMRFVPESPLASDLAAVDNFTLNTTADLEAVEFVLAGSYFYSGPESIEAYEVNIYSDLSAASESLIGDVHSSMAAPQIIESWTGEGLLIRLEIDATLAAGGYFLSVIMSNPYPDNGWVGVATSTLGDDSAWAASPGGNYVFAPLISTSDNLAYRLTGASIPEPASAMLVGVAGLLGLRRRRRR